MTNKIMALLHENYIHTSTSLSATSGTTGVANLIDRDTATKWLTTGYDAGTSVTITYAIPGGGNTTVSRFFLRGCNFGQFRAFYDGVTANVFNPDINIASNTASDLYFEAATQAVSTITFQIDTTYPLNAEKTCAELYIGDMSVDFPRNPSFENYNPLLYRKGKDLEMADGGMVTTRIKNKFRAEISLDFVSESKRDEFRACYDSNRPKYFIPFPIDGFTTTSQWDGEAVEVNWLGDFDFLKLSSNIRNNGFVGVIQLAETPGK